MTALLELQMLETRWSPNNLVKGLKQVVFYSYIFVWQNCKDPISYHFQTQLYQYTQCQASTRRALPNCHKSDISCFLGPNQNKSCFWQGINSFLDCLSTLFTILSAQLVGCIATCPSLILTGKIQTKSRRNQWRNKVLYVWVTMVCYTNIQSQGEEQQEKKETPNHKTKTPGRVSIHFHIF